MFEVETRIEPPMKVDPQIENLAVFQQHRERLSEYLTQGFDDQLRAGVVLQDSCDTVRERFGSLGEDEIHRSEANLSYTQVKNERIVWDALNY